MIPKLPDKEREAHAEAKQAEERMRSVLERLARKLDEIPLEDGVEAVALDLGKPKHD